jgi:LuxR family maltose regulon positive regulatory protein
VATVTTRLAMLVLPESLSPEQRPVLLLTTCAAPRPARAGPAASSRSGATGYVRVFADEGPPMGAVLARRAAARRAGQSSAAAVPPGYLAALARACGQADATAPRSRAAGAAPGLVEPLTDRELEVLRLLAAGRSNQRIAHDLVALDTVKKHVTHLLGKLGAANRTEAAARARDLGLIP